MDDMCLDLIERKLYYKRLGGEIWTYVNFGIQTGKDYFKERTA
jgi:hypothetical protein